MTGCVTVNIGPDSTVDPGVILGYPPGRPGTFGDVRIGRGARIRIGSVICAEVEIGDEFETGLVAGNPARVISTVDALECPFDIVTPYVGGVDVRRRPVWTTVAALPRPVVRPPKNKS